MSAVADIPRASRSVFGGDASGDEFTDNCYEFIHGDPVAERQVHWTFPTHPALQCVANDGDHRVHTGEVSSLLSITVDSQRLALQCCPDEFRDDGCLIIISTLQRSVDVEEPKSECIEAVDRWHDPDFSVQS